MSAWPVLSVVTATLREQSTYQGVRHDMEIWSLLAHEWKGEQPSA